MKRLLFLVLGLVGGGCASAGRPVTWIETVATQEPPGVYARVFMPGRRWHVGDCFLSAGSHITLRPSGRADFGFGIYVTREDAQFQFGITMLAADGTTLAHFPRANGGQVYVLKDIPVGRDEIRGGTIPISRDVYDRVERVLIHATC
jgi:hypothetical protein